MDRPALLPPALLPGGEVVEEEEEEGEGEGEQVEGQAGEEAVLIGTPRPQAQAQHRQRGCGLGPAAVAGVGGGQRKRRKRRGQQQQQQQQRQRQRQQRQGAGGVVAGGAGGILRKAGAKADDDAGEQPEDRASGRFGGPKQRQDAAGKKPAPAEYECSICYELLLDPVVGNCGHDLCKHCYEKWRQYYYETSQQMVKSGLTCPMCRQKLPEDLGVCVRLKNTIENLFPHCVRERRKQVEALIEEERAKHTRRESTSNSIPNAFYHEYTPGAGASEHNSLMLSSEDARRLQYILERWEPREIGSTMQSGSSRIVPVQFSRPSTALSQSGIQSVGHGASLGLTGPTEVQGIGIPALPTAAAVISVPAAITTPQWPSTPAPASMPINLRPAVPSTVQQVITPALVLSPTTSVSPAPAQFTPIQWGGPLGDVVFTMGWYDREQGQTRRRVPRRRNSIRHHFQHLR